jgi:hypothetical protein
MVGTTFDTATTSLATECITNAENKIREILSKRYDVSSAAFQTSTSTPPVVQTLCKWLATGYMYENLSRGGKDAFTRADRYIKKAMDNMSDIVAYKANIIDSTGSVLTESTESMPMYSNTDDYSETFNEDSPLDWAVDSDKLDDISTDRE